MISKKGEWSDEDREDPSPVHLIRIILFYFMEKYVDLRKYPKRTENQQVTVQSLFPSH